VQHRKARHSSSWSAARQQAREILIAADRQELVGAKIDAVDLIAIRTVTDGALSPVQACACLDDEVIGCGLLILRCVLRREGGNERKGRGRPE